MNPKVEQTSVFDAWAVEESRESPVAPRSCRNCAHLAILPTPKRVPGYPGARTYGYCFKRPGNRYAIYIADSKCAQWRAR